MGKKIQRTALARAMGREIREWRDRFSREQIVEISRVKKNTIIKIEHGKCQHVSSRDINRVITALARLNKINEERFLRIKKLAKIITEPRLGVKKRIAHRVTPHKYKSFRRGFRKK